MAQTMERTSYEAAAAWDACRSRDRGEPLFSGDLLVLDLDLGGAGVCRCAGDGRIQLAGQTECEPIPPFLSDMGGIFVEDPFRDRTLRMYLRSGRRIDPPAVQQVSLLWLHCGEVEEAFQEKTAPALDNLLGRAEELLDRLGVPRESMGVLTVGIWAPVVFVQHRIRARFSPDPFLPDSRFRDTAGEDPTQIVAKGRALYQAGQVEPRPLLGHDIALCVLEGWGFGLPVRPVERPLGAKDTPLESLASPAFTEPFYLDAGEPLEVLVDGERRTLFQLEGEFPKQLLALPVKAGLRADETGAFLVLRGCALPDLEDRELPIPLEGKEKEHG